MHLGDPNFLNAIRDSILASSTFTSQFTAKFTAKWLADRNNVFKGELMNSFTNNQLFTALGTYNKPLLITKMDQSGLITLAYLNTLNCSQLLGYIDAVNPGLIPALYMTNAPPLPVPMSPVATTRNNAICSNVAAKNNIYNMLLVGSNRTFLLQALRSFPTATLFTGISNWTSLRTNLLSEPLEYGYITTLYPAECNTYYNAYNSITLVNMIKDVDNYSFILKALDIKLSLAGNILAMQKAIMTFINDLSLYLNPTQMNNLWNSLLGTYGTPKAELSLSELDLYGSKRLGVIEDTISLNKFHFTGNYNPSNQRYDIYSYYSPTYTAIPNYNLTYWTYGKKKYELTNHLGNVLSTVSDYKIPYLNTSGKLCYRADIRSENRYYAFGGMKDSGFVAGRKGRYGFNGKPDDNETDYSDFGERGYDKETGRWISRDKLEMKYPGISTYSYTYNNPIIFNDPDGNAGKLSISINGNTGSVSLQSTIYLYGPNASQYSADRANEAFGGTEVRMVNYQNVQITAEVTLKYVYSKELTEALKDMPTDSRGGHSGVDVSQFGVQPKDNILNIDIKTNFQEYRSGMQGIASEYWGKTARAVTSEKGIIIHESLHEMGYGEQYSSFGIPFEGYLNDVMAGNLNTKLTGPQFYDIVDFAYKTAMESQGNRINVPNIGPVNDIINMPTNSFNWSNIITSITPNLNGGTHKTETINDLNDKPVNEKKENVHPKD